MKKKKENKTKRVEIRLTEEEYLMFKEKAKNYSCVSSFIVDSVKTFDDRLGREKIKFINNFSIVIKEYMFELNKIGNNINQIATYFNVKAKRNDYEIKNDPLASELSTELSNIKHLFKILKKKQNKAINDAFSLFRNTK